MLYFDLVCVAVINCCFLHHLSSLASQAFDVRKEKLARQETHIPDMEEGLKALTKAVEIAIPVLGKGHKFVDEARKWQVRLHTQVQQFALLQSMT